MKTKLMVWILLLMFVLVPGASALTNQFDCGDFIDLSKFAPGATFRLGVCVTVELQHVSGIIFESDVAIDVSGGVTEGQSLVANSSSNFVPSVPCPGYIKNAWADYLNTTQVVFSTGEGACNGSYWEISANTITSTVTTLAAAADWHYGYIDDDASSYPTPTIIWSTTEPSESTTLYGWYNGDDRCIGAVYSDASGATIFQYTRQNESGRVVFLARTLQSASSMNPDGTWQTPDDAETSTFLPVNCVFGLFVLSAYDGDNPVEVALATKERADAGAAALSGGEMRWYLYGHGQVVVPTPWIAMGASCNLRIGGENDDDNGLNMWVLGYQEAR